MRMDSKLNAQVVNCMKLLELEKLDELPLMEEVCKQFLKLVKAKHPDGGFRTKENFVEIMEAKEFLMNYLKNNRLEYDQKEDEEEALFRKEYDLANR